MRFYGIYPLVNFYITIENHIVTWKTHYFDGHFQEQTVSLPEGIYKGYLRNGEVGNHQNTIHIISWSIEVVIVY